MRTWRLLVITGLFFGAGVGAQPQPPMRSKITIYNLKEVFPGDLHRRRDLRGAQLVAGWKVFTGEHRRRFVPSAGERIPADGGGLGDAKAEQVTNDEWEDWFPHISPDGKWMLVFAFPKGTATHNDRMEGVILRLMRAPGAKLKPAKLVTLVTFFGGQGTLNVNSWSPDSKKFAYVSYELLPAGSTPAGRK